MFFTSPPFLFVFISVFVCLLVVQSNAFPTQPSTTLDLDDDNDEQHNSPPTTPNNPPRTTTDDNDNDNDNDNNHDDEDQNKAKPRTGNKRSYEGDDDDQLDGGKDLTKRDLEELQLQPEQKSDSQDISRRQDDQEEDDQEDSTTTTTEVVPQPIILDD